MSIVNALARAQAPSGAAWETGRPLMPLLTELELASVGGPYYRHGAPNGAGQRVGRRDSCKAQGAYPALQTFRGDTHQSPWTVARKHYFAVAGASRTAGLLTWPVRPTAEIATTSGNVRFHARAVLLAGSISLSHFPSVLVCSSHSQAVAERFWAQRSASPEPESRLETVSSGEPGRARLSQGIGGTSAG